MSENKTANPGPLGLLGFGMTTVLLNLHNSGIIELSAVIVAMGFAMGGLAQIIAGIKEFSRNNIFGATAFTAYGCFWWSLIFIWNPVFGGEPADPLSMGFYLLLWGIFTGFMSVATLKHNIATRVVFFSLTALFLLLALGDFTGVEAIHVLAGVVGIVCGLSAIYASVAQVINAEFGKEVLPMGSHK
ncbi:hypothetical protein AGMMS49975_16930 [Clostridia bacterium]|nr:hypothetical protein AGMMS49975_16930 [Clostridia bacterium]GHU74472.1 hypothetical protein FACS1894188_02790 [Clostridia bacterium]